MHKKIWNCMIIVVLNFRSPASCDASYGAVLGAVVGLFKWILLSLFKKMDIEQKIKLLLKEKVSLYDSRLCPRELEPISYFSTEVLCGPE